MYIYTVTATVNYVFLYIFEPFFYFKMPTNVVEREYAFFWCIVQASVISIIDRKQQIDRQVSSVK